MKAISSKLVLKTLLVSALWLAPSFALAQPEKAVLVTVTEVVAEDMSPLIPTAGTVFSRNATQITAGLAARVEWIAEPGDFVRAGGAVARFDCDMLELRRDELVATAEREEVNVYTFSREADRLERAREALVASESQLLLMQGERDRAASELKIAQVRIRQTENDLERCVARAPFDGVVTGNETDGSAGRGADQCALRGIAGFLLTRVRIQCLAAAREHGDDAEREYDFRGPRIHVSYLWLAMVTSVL